MLRTCALVLVLAASHRAAAQARLPTPPTTSRPVSAMGYARELLWRSAPSPVVVDHPVLRVSHDLGIISTGITLMSLGMIMGTGVASSDAANGNCRGAALASAPVECGSEPFALMPIVGGALVGAVHLRGEYESAWPLAVGLSAIVPQLAGLVLLLVGVHGQTVDVVPRADLDGSSLSIAPFASRDAIGVAIGITR